MSLSIQPMQWGALPDLDEVPPLDDSDLQCLEALRDVLARRGKLRRFAIHLAHRHFALGADEILIERPDPDGRTQHVTVGRLAEAPDARPTTWLFEEGLSCDCRMPFIASAYQTPTRRTPAAGMAKAVRPVRRTRRKSG
jgi:hypothetical protein